MCCRVNIIPKKNKRDVENLKSSQIFSYCHYIYTRQYPMLPICLVTRLVARAGPSIIEIKKNKNM